MDISRDQSEGGESVLMKMNMSIDNINLSYRRIKASVNFIIITIPQRNPWTYNRELIYAVESKWWGKFKPKTLRKV